MKIEEAATKIETILRDLELATGKVVHSVCIRDDGCSTFTGNTVLRYVDIEMSPKPGTGWVGE